MAWCAGLWTVCDLILNLIRGILMVVGQPLPHTPPAAGLSLLNSFLCPTRATLPMLSWLLKCSLGQHSTALICHCAMVSRACLSLSPLPALSPALSSPSFCATACLLSLSLLVNTD
jgi:hypothetical protein